MHQYSIIGLYIVKFYMKGLASYNIRAVFIKTGNYLWGTFGHLKKLF